MTIQLEPYEFAHVCAIQPERAADSHLARYYPHRQIRTKLPLLPFGRGPFCRFQIPATYTYAGVYLLTVAGTAIYYLGETVNLTRRFNQGYGSIHPRACYQGGQITNLRLNRMILLAALADIDIDLWFYQTQDYKRVEHELIDRVQPKWNRQGRRRGSASKPVRQIERPEGTPSPAPTLWRGPSCRDEILDAFKELTLLTGFEEFAVPDVIEMMRVRGTRYSENTIRTHITSRMCANAPNHHAVTYDDLIRTGKGLYRLNR
jgi:hypothetical protein